MIFNSLNIAYWLGNQTLMFYLAAKFVELSVKGGIVPGTCVAFQYLGLAAVEFYKQYSYGHVNEFSALVIPYVPITNHLNSDRNWVQLDWLLQKKLEEIVKKEEPSIHMLLSLQYGNITSRTQ